jgi:hypothetical protein
MGLTHHNFGVRKDITAATRGRKDGGNREEILTIIIKAIGCFF